MYKSRLGFRQFAFAKKEKSREKDSAGKRQKNENVSGE
jgi:hypothetical protein